MTLKKIVFTVVILIYLPFSLSSFELKSISLEGGPLMIMNTDDEGAPSPILPNIGACFEIEHGDAYFMPSVNLSWNYYQLDEKDTSLVQPAEIEYADSLLLLNILIDFPYSMRYELKEKLEWGWLASPAVMLKLPLKAWGEGEDQRSDILGYFYAGRFIYLEGGGYLLWNYSEKNSFKTMLSFYLPVYQLWNGKSFIDEMMFRLGFGFSFKSKN